MEVPTQKLWSCLLAHKAHIYQDLPTSDLDIIKAACSLLHFFSDFNPSIIVV